MIKAILFDVDGVLVDSLKANELYKKKLFRQAGYEDVDDIIEDSFHKPFKQVVKEVLESKNITDKKEADKLFKLMIDPELRDFQAKYYKFPKDLKEILEKLHERFTLGVVTSRVRLGAEEILNLAEIDKYFDVVISVDDVTNYKPHPEPLQKALKRLGLEAEEAVYIGDSDTDILAAHAAGMASIHLSEVVHEAAHHQIYDFSEIIEGVKAIEQNNANNNS